DVERVDVGFGVDRDAAEACVPAGARHPDSDLASVGDENFTHGRTFLLEGHRASMPWASLRAGGPQRGAGRGAGGLSRVEAAAPGVRAGPRRHAEQPGAVAPA